MSVLGPLRVLRQVDQSIAQHVEEVAASAGILDRTSHSKPPTLGWPIPPL